MEAPQLDRLSLLRSRSITEIIFGVLGGIGIIYSFTRQGVQIGGSVGNLILTVLLLAAGSLGVHAVNKARSHDFDAQLFRICGILNIVLCVLYCLELLILVVGGILLAVSRTAGLLLLEQFGIIHSPTAVFVETAEIDHVCGRTEAPDQTVVGAMVIVALVIAILWCILMIAVTAVAANLARRNQAIIETRSTVPVAGYPMSSPGYTRYSLVKTHDHHHA